ncbi:F0F1 ATP synthase subunit epsilon [bacterium]|nr:F0F1 ATP synthase subunit epsilon [bacterium]
MEKQKIRSKIKYRIIAPTHVIKEHEADFIMVPSIEGDVGIISKHAPLLANLRKGIIRIKNGESAEELDVKHGFVEVLDDLVTILVNE